MAFFSLGAHQIYSMIAKVALKQKTAQQFQLFSYKVKAEFLPEIRTGQIVEVNFNQKPALGVIIQLSPQKPRAASYKLKSIKKVLNPSLRVSNWQIQLAKYISQKYAVCFGQALFSFLPKLVKKNLSAPVIAASEVAMGKTSKIRYLTDSKLKRWRQFQKIASRHPAIFIFPQLQQARLFIQKFCPDCQLFHSALPAKKQTQIYLNCLSKNPPTIAGAFSALFLPVRAVIIIEDFLSTIYQKDQSPKYEIVQIARKLTQLKRAPLILADDSLPFWLAKPLEKNRIKIETGSNLAALREKNLKITGRHLTWHPFENPTAFSQPHPPADLVHLIFPSSYLSLPDYRLNEEIFYLFKKALNLSSKQIIVYLENETQKEKIQQIFKSDFKIKELQARKKYHFPPFWELIKIDYRQKLSPDKLKKISYNIKQGIKNCQIIDQKYEEWKTSFILKAPRSANLNYSKIYPGIVSRNLKKINLN